MQKTKRDAEYYLNQISAASAREEKYRKICQDIDKNYCGENYYNVLFSNTELLLGALVCQNPKPVIRTRFPRQNAQNLKEKALALTVGEAVERAVIYNNDNIDFKGVLEDIVLCALLNGRGVAWLSYEPEIEQKPMPEQNPPEDEPLFAEEIKSQRVKLKCVDYEDFRFGFAKRWEDVPWVAVRHLLNKKEAKARFGASAAEKLNYSYRPVSNREEKDLKLACVWEFWHKADGNVVFVSEGFDGVLKTAPNPYGLEGFFPMPEPLRFIKAKKLKAVPEYIIYRKEAESLERTERRIDALVKNIKANAVAAAKNKEELASVLEAGDGEIVTVQTGDIAAAGGLSGVIMEYPNEGKVKVVQSLVTRKADLLETIYAVTGIADILRGQSNAQETAAAQRIKGRFGSLRLQKRQSQVQEFIRGIYRVMTDIVCEHFTQETLKNVSSLELLDGEEKAALSLKTEQLAEQGSEIPPKTAELLQKPSWDEVITVLRQNGLRSYIIDVESSATAFDDEAEDKSARSELFTAVTSVLQNALPAMAQQPSLVPLYKQLINFWVDGFKYSRTLKESLNESLNAFEAALKTPQPQQPQPEMLLAQAEQVKAQAELLNARANAEQGERELILKAQKEAQELEIKKQKLLADIAKLEAELFLKRQNLNAPGPAGQVR